MSIMCTYGTREIRTTLRTQMFFTQDFVTQNLWNWLRSHSNVYVYHIQLLLEAVKKLDLTDKHMVLLAPWVASTPYFGIKFLVLLDVSFFLPFLFLSFFHSFHHVYSLSIWIFKILAIHLPWWLTPVILVTWKSRAAE